MRQKVIIETYFGTQTNGEACHLIQRLFQHLRASVEIYILKFRIHEVTDISMLILYICHFILLTQQLFVVLKRTSRMNHLVQSIVYDGVSVCLQYLTIDVQFNYTDTNELMFAHLFLSIVL
jgi:hypothetical protein